MLKQDAGATRLRLCQGGGMGLESCLVGVEAALCLEVSHQNSASGGMGLWGAHIPGGIRTCVLGGWCTFLP